MASGVKTMNLRPPVVPFASGRTSSQAHTNPVGRGGNNTSVWLSQPPPRSPLLTTSLIPPACLFTSPPPPGSLLPLGRPLHAALLTSSNPGGPQEEKEEEDFYTSEDSSDSSDSSMYEAEDTIAALATPVVPQAGGIAIIRVSGEEAVKIVGNIFRPVRSNKVVEAPPPQAPSPPVTADSSPPPCWEPVSYRAQYGTIVDAAGKPLDEVIVLPMLAPRSYTGEDVVEVHCHGGLVPSARVLSACVEGGARPAGPGEFTLRALLAGRIDLAQAEAVQQLVAARTQAAADGALCGLRGEGAPALAARAARQVCVQLMAEVEARLDFDEDLPPLDVSQLRNDIDTVTECVAQAIRDAKRAVVAHTGAVVALVGRPNVGKSSLLNAWTRSERAIVTSVPGTTRDVLEAQVEVCGVPVTLLDTAGIRETADEVERIGVERSREAARSADLLMLLMDASQGWTAADQEIFDAHLASRSGVPAVLLVNKIDLQALDGVSLPGEEVLARFTAVVPASTCTWEGLEGVSDVVGDQISEGGVLAEGGAWAGSQRQVDALMMAHRALCNLQETMAMEDLPVDMWTIDLRDATTALGSVTGEEVTEDVLDDIFSRFCIGK